MTATKPKTAPTKYALDLRPTAVDSDSFGRPKVPDPRPTPDPDMVGVLVPDLRPAAEELARMRAEATAARRAWAAIDNEDAEAEDRRKANFGEDPSALDTRPGRVRAARLEAATTQTTVQAGLYAWQRLLGDVDLGAQLRERMQERSSDVSAVLASLDQARPVIELLDQLHVVREWLAPQRDAVRNVTSAPHPDAGGHLTELLDALVAALTSAIADDAQPGDAAA